MTGAAIGPPATGGRPTAGKEQCYSLTFGVYNQTAPWTDVRALTLRELACLLTTHEVGAKEGSCVVPALFSGSRRQKAHAVRIEIAFLDSDSGAGLAEIRETLKGFGWAAIVSSTYSHLTMQTVVKRSHWDRFCTKHADQAQLAG